MDALHRFFAEITESAVLSCLEPHPLAFTKMHEDDVPRMQAAIRRAANGKLARFRYPMNRNGFLLGCLHYTEPRREEHLFVGYGYRYGSTTKIVSLHHIFGEASSVAIPSGVAHAMWDYYRRAEANELILFHNHPVSPLSLILDNLPLASQADRNILRARAFNPEQFLRTVLGHGRVLFFLGENGWVKQFRLPSALSLIERQHA